MTKGIKRYFKDNLGIIAALVIMILFPEHTLHF